jgi:hypothetical protein
MRKPSRRIRPVVGKRKFNQLSDLIFRRDEFACRVCGAPDGAPSAFDLARPVRLKLGYIAQRSQAAMNSIDNLRTECTDCFEGLRFVPLPKDIGFANLVSIIQTVTSADQRWILDELRRKFPDER